MKIPRRLVAGLLLGIGLVLPATALAQMTPPAQVTQGAQVAPGAAEAPVAGSAKTVQIDPWQALTELRLHLAASGALVAAFRQSFVPAGFATGDEETGRVALALPDCLRWDYAEPYPKSYLLCGSRLHTWVTGEPQGERLHVEAREEAGLDLLLLPVELLKARYSAVARQAGAGAITVDLQPFAADSRIAHAELLFDPAAQRPTALAYRDRDGNLSTFRFGTFDLLDDDTLFTPPSNLIWKEP
ncbi:MAG: outer rane lipoprotein carrier protein [Acidobacteriota bacterium]|nr:outer rane lipoprotein carrier protein [Acidobacteriota bacterium]